MSQRLFRFYWKWFIQVGHFPPWWRVKLSRILLRAWLDNFDWIISGQIISEFPIWKARGGPFLALRDVKQKLPTFPQVTISILKPRGARPVWTTVSWPSSRMHWSAMEMWACVPRLIIPSQTKMELSCCSQCSARQWMCGWKAACDP